MRYQTYLDTYLPDLAGQIIVITGANSGIGFEAARMLSFKGATVVMACRNLEKATEAKAKIVATNATAKLDILEYDQASLSSINHFVKALKERYPRIHAIVCNAGIYLPPRKEVMDHDLRLTIGTNFIGLYYLLRQMTPYIDKPGAPTRVIFVSSISAYHQRHRSWDYLLNHRQTLFQQYANSKLAINKLFHVLANGMNLYDFQDRKNVSYFLMHPGVTATNIIHNFPKWFQRLAWAFLTLFVHHSDKAALGIVYLAGSKHVFNGSYYVPRGLFEISGMPEKRPFPKWMVQGSGQFMYDVGHYVQKLEKTLME